jgi:toxin CcdB
MSRQFDIYPNPSRAGREDRPFVIVVQHPFFDDMPTRVVGPLVVIGAMRPRLRLNPVVTVENRDFYFSPTELATISLKYLRNPIANLEADRDRIVAAIDLVFTGI